MKVDHTEDLKTLEQGEAFVRSVLAFLLYLRFGSAREIDNCYVTSDKFIKKLKEDLTS